jgi:hypothetical protein
MDQFQCALKTSNPHKVEVSRLAEEWLNAQKSELEARQRKANVLLFAKAWSKGGGAVHFVYEVKSKGKSILTKVIFNDRIYNVYLGVMNDDDDDECLWDDIS